MFDEEGDSTDGLVAHGYGGDLVTRGCRRRLIDGKPDLGSVNVNQDGGHERGGVRQQIDLSRHFKAGGAAWVDEAAHGLSTRLHLVGVGGHEHRQPLRGADDGVLDLCQPVRHAGLGHVLDEGGAESSADVDEDKRAEARGVLLRL